MGYISEGRSTSSYLELQDRILGLPGGGALAYLLREWSSVREGEKNRVSLIEELVLQQTIRTYFGRYNAKLLRVPRY